MSKNVKSSIMLLIVAIVWGGAFVAQKEGTDCLGPFAFNGVKNIMGGLCLIPLILIRKKKQTSQIAEKGTSRNLIIGSVLCGVALTIAGGLQQVGLAYTTVAKAGFITALYVVLVPITGIFIKKKVSLLVWICAIASVFGLYLLCMPAGGGFGKINIGDVLMFICAFGYAAHILVVDKYSPLVDSIKLSCYQFMVAGILSFALMPAIDTMVGYGLPTMQDFANGLVPLLYAGIVSTGLGFTLQVTAQKDANPVVASMILCLESVFAVILAMIILKEFMSPRELTGSIIMFAAIVIAQLPIGNKKQIADK